MAESDFRFDEKCWVNETIKNQYDKNGYVILRELLSKTELDKLKTALEHDEGILTKACYVSDGGKEKITRLCVWNHPGNDITGMIARSNKVAGTLEQLMKGEIYHYHTKLMMKDAYGGGKFLWHQDYGYWYFNGVMYPDLVTCFIAVDKTDVENGCLQVIPGSHLAGRLDHNKVGGQYEADPERVEYFKNKLGLVNVELMPGDALMFHCNLLHKSEVNNSPNRRWAFLMAYHKATNNPIKKHHHPRYVKLDKVENSEITKCTTTTDLRNKGFILQTGDASSFTVEDDHLN